MYPDTQMYPPDRKPNAGWKPADARSQDEMALRQALQVFRRSADSFLLLLGGIALVGVVPVLWIWVLYGSGFGSPVVSAAAIALCVLTAGIGFAMLRILDGRR
jgi:hypothetical protein